MKYKLTWAREAKADLKAIRSYISQFAPRVAESYIRRIRERCLRFTAHPYAASIVEEFQDERVRETYLGSYRIIFEIEEKRIVVLRVFHGARLLGDEHLHE
jgi:addiction module RelE/StbE family toxin